MLIDLVQLRTFVAVAEEQHLTRAAERLHLSQSAASAHVRAVEEVLDTVLFDRAARRLELTQAGRLLLDKAKDLLNHAALFGSFAREIAGQAVGSLVVGSSSDPGVSRIGAILARLRRDYPFVHIDLRALPSSGTRQGLKAGELDAGIFLGKPVDTELCYRQLTTVRFVVAGPAAWRQQIVSADWARLAALPWVTPADRSMAYSVMLQQMFGDRGLEPNSVAQVDNEAVGRALMYEGVGLMLVRVEHALEGERAGKLAASPIAQADFALFLAYAKNRSIDPLVQAFESAAQAIWNGESDQAKPSA